MPHVMSPLFIEMLLHVHCRCEPYNDRGGRAQAAVMKFFKRAELIRPCAKGEEGSTFYGEQYRTTERGAALVKKLCATPLPIPVTEWV